MKKILLTLLACSGLVFAQSNFYIGAIDNDHKITAQSNAWEAASDGQVDKVLRLFQREVLLYLDGQALATWPSAEMAPQPGLMLFRLDANPSAVLSEQTVAWTSETAWFGAGQWLDQDQKWHSLLATNLGRPLRAQEVQAMSWPQLGSMLETMRELTGGNLTPVLTEPSDLADPLTPSELSSAAPADAQFVLVLMVASPGEGEYRYEHRPTMLMYF